MPRTRGYPTLYLFNEDTEEIEEYVGLGEELHQHIALVAGFAYAVQELQQNFWFDDGGRAGQILDYLTTVAAMN